MKKPCMIKTVLVLILFFAFCFIQVNASVDPAFEKESAAALVKLKLMQGDTKGNLLLQDKIKRCELITLVVRMLGYDKNPDTGNVVVSFKDISVKHWAYGYIKAALKYGIITGYPDNTVGPNNNVTYAEVLTIIIRSLGYEKTLIGKWPDNVLAKATELGINVDIDFPQNQQVTRGQVSVLIYNSLTIDMKKD